MISQEEKLAAFLKAINDYAHSQQQRILTELENRNRAALERAERETLSDAYHMINQQTADVRNSISRDLSARELESRRKLLEQRAQIEQRVFERAQAKLAEFAASEKYAEHLCACAESAGQVFAQSGDVKLLVRQSDMQYAAQLEESCGIVCTVEACDDILIGGLRAMCEQAGKIADYTLDSALEAQHEWFAENSALSVS